MGLLRELRGKTRLLQQRVGLVNIVLPLRVDNVDEWLQVLHNLFFHVDVQLVVKREGSDRAQNVVSLYKFAYLYQLSKLV